MTSKKEEERNEKVIRGLMKLPPNRRCINCNSLGPQYVCTNFWTFTCTTCSGIHREFTHRVKSVSMSKFTSQEVEALQNGGNQRAREIYLKDWDLQMQRLPDSSKVEKVREFIKNVYVDKKYAGGKTNDKPPRDRQGLRNHEDETRRASSYHSYSQSPPYDYQYEERRYGKQLGSSVLTRKPGSDRGLEAKISSFVYSPGRLSEKAAPPEDKFANEGSAYQFDTISESKGKGIDRSNSIPLKSVNSSSLIDQFKSPTITSPASSQVSIPKDEGWATFDLPQPAVIPPNPITSTMHWPSSFQNSIPPWHDEAEQQVQVGTNTPHSWNAFNDSVGPFHPVEQSSQQYASLVDQYSVSEGSKQTHGTEYRSTNPFDVPFDFEPTPSDMFLDMGSLHGTLPSIPPQLSEPPLPYIPGAAATTAQGGFAYIGGGAPGAAASELPRNVQGGNPFA